MIKIVWIYKKKSKEELPQCSEILRINPRDIHVLTLKRHLNSRVHSRIIHTWDTETVGKSMAQQQIASLALSSIPDPHYKAAQNSQVWK